MSAKHNAYICPCCFDSVFIGLNKPAWPAEQPTQSGRDNKDCLLTGALSYFKTRTDINHHYGSSTLKKHHFISMWTLNIQLRMPRFTGMKSLFVTVKLKVHHRPDAELADSELNPRFSTSAAAARCRRHVWLSSRRETLSCFTILPPPRGKSTLRTQSTHRYSTRPAWHDWLWQGRHWEDEWRHYLRHKYWIITRSEGVMDSTQPTNQNCRILHTTAELLNDSRGPWVTHAQNCFMIVCLEAFSDCWTEPKRGSGTTTPEVQDSLDCGKQLIIDPLEPN